MDFLDQFKDRRQLLKKRWWVATVPTLLFLLLAGVVATVVNSVWPFLQISPEQSPEVLALLTQIRGPVISLIIIAITFAILLSVTYLLSFLHWRAVALRERLDKEKTGFVRMAADTIRTPLTGLRWLTELLMADDLGVMNPEQKESVGNMQRAIERLISLVNELLSIMQLSGGIIHYQPKPSDVNIVIKGTIEDVKNLAAAKYQTVGFGGLSRDSAMMMDEPLIRHLLSTLITNAMHFAAVREAIVVHAEPKEGEMIIGITYTGEALPLKSIGTEGNQGGLSMITQDAVQGADDPLNMTISWEILGAAKGRFWIRDEGSEHTLFVALPKGNK